MDLRDSLSTVTATAAERAAEARESASAGAAQARDTAATVRDRASSELPERLSGATRNADRLVGRVRSYSIPTGRLRETNADLPVLAHEYGLRALGLAHRIDFDTTYRYGKAGFEYGGTYGRYVPFGGNALPYVGLLAGLGAGVLEGVDVVSAETLQSLTRHAPAAVERFLEREGVPTDGHTHLDGLAAVESAADTVGDWAVDGQRVDDFVGMDYDEFAGR